MHRLVKINYSAFAGLVFASLYVHAQGASTIYKHVDENGRVTYSNAPIKGAARVDLQPITVFPSASVAITPIATSTAANGNIAVARVTTAPRAAKAITVAVSPAKPETLTKSAETSLSPVEEGETSATLNAPPLKPLLNTGTESTIAPSVSMSTRQDDAQRRTLQHSLLGEQESLANAKARLAEESKNSESMRALRASFSAGPDQAGIRKIITAEMRVQVERHFERIRDLQDEIAMHENNVASLRAQLRAAPATGVIAAK